MPPPFEAVGLSSEAAAHGDNLELEVLVKARAQDALFHGKIEFLAQAHGATRVAEIARKVHLVGDQVTGSAPRLVAERALALDAAEVAARVVHVLAYIHIRVLGAARLEVAFPRRQTQFSVFRDVSRPGLKLAERPPA